MRKYLIIGSLFLLVSLSLTLFSACQNNNKDKDSYESYVYVDINPSFELMVDKEGKVTGFYKTNEDAHIMMNEKTVVGLDVDVAVLLLIDEANKQGYLVGTNKAVSVTALADKEEIKTKVMAKVLAKVDAYKQNNHLEMTLVQDHETPTSGELARSVSLKVSVGKLRLVETLMSYDVNLTYDEAINLSISEIMTRLKAYQDEQYDMLPKTYQNAIQAMIAKRYMTFRLAKVSLISALAQAKLLLDPAFFDLYLEGKDITKSDLVGLYQAYQQELLTVDTTSSLTVETEINLLVEADTVVIDKVTQIDQINLEIKALFDGRQQGQMLETMTTIKDKLALKKTLMLELDARVHELLTTNYPDYVDTYVYMNGEVKLLVSKEYALEYKAIYEKHDLMFKEYGLSIETFEALFDLGLKTQIETIQNTFNEAMALQRQAMLEMKASLGYQLQIEIAVKKQFGHQ